MEIRLRAREEFADNRFQTPLYIDRYRLYRYIDDAR